MPDATRADVEYAAVRIMLCPTCVERSLWRRAVLSKKAAVVECALCDYRLGWATFTSIYGPIVGGQHDRMLGERFAGDDPTEKSSVAVRRYEFWGNVDKDGPVPAHRPGIGNCWVWRGANGRYGTFDKEPAHRVSYAYAWGGIPDDAFICHRCDNPSCVRPSHLFLGNALLNTEDMMQKGRHRTRGGTQSRSW